MKSREFLEQLPYPFYGQIKEYLKNEGLESKLEDTYDTFADALDQTVAWANTPQGHEYWGDIYRYLKNLKPDTGIQRNLWKVLKNVK